MNATDGDVRQMLDLLTVGQPTAPPDRAASVRRRVRRYRRNLAAGTLAVAVGLTAVGVGLARGGVLGGGTGPVSPTRAVPRWALPWPDHRNGSVPQRVLDGAVFAWRHLNELTTGSWPMTAPRRVIWYAGQTVARGQVVAVIFEVDAPVGHRLVAGWTAASEVMNGQPGWQKSGSSPWVLYDVPAPRNVPGLAIGLNPHGTTARPGLNPDAWIVVLAAPNVRSMTFQAPAGMSPDTVVNAVGIGTTSRGLMTGDVGQITGPVEITKLLAGHRNLLLSPVSVGVPGAPASTIPQLARPAPLRLVFRGETGEVDGQGDVSVGYPSGPPKPITVIVVRCYGPAPLRLLIGDPTRPRFAGTVACDDAQHVLRYHGAQPRHGSMLSVRTSELTSYRVAYGV
jgi:hypothetical protein